MEVTARIKQLLVRATDLLLERLDDPARLIEERLLPACYRRRYDAEFLERAATVLELTRNVLVGDLPHLATTAEELAGHAILTVAARLPDADELAEALHDLRTEAFEDDDVLLLFDVPADQDPAEHVTGPIRPDEWPLLRYEHWLLPFGDVPRPQIAADGRAWPARR